MNSYIKQLIGPMIMIKVPSMTKLPRFINIMSFEGVCRNPTLAKCGGEAQHLEKSEELESSGTPECSELDIRTQNTSH